jgi:hypothetical protein
MKFLPAKKIIKPLMLAVVIFGSFFISNSTVFGAVNNVWSSTGSTDYNTDANWSLGHIPTTGELAYFDATSVVNCSLSADVAPDAITMGATYTGTLEIGTYNMAVLGDASFAGKVTMGISSNTGLTAVNFTMAAGGVWTGTGAGKITISGNFDQSSVSSRFNASTATITINGNGSFTANGTLASAQYNSASLVLNGTNTFAYNNNAAANSNGFNNFTCGQSGNTTTLASAFLIKGILTIGSGTLTFPNGTVFFSGATPFSFDTANSVISVGTIIFYSTTAQMPTLTKGYDSNIAIYGTNTTITQTGNVTLNSTKCLLMGSAGMGARVQIWNTDGYNLTVGGYLQIGTGADTGLKKLNATRNVGAGRTSTITVGGNWLNYGNGTVPSQFVADNSTVILTGTGAGGTITSGTINSSFYNLQFNGIGGVWTAQDNIVVGGNLTVTAGTFNVGIYNLAVTGNSTINANLTLGASATNGWTTTNLTIGAGGIVTANGTYYNQVTVTGTLNPDATGIYTFTGMVLDIYGSYYPKYRKGTSSYYINKSDIWYITSNGGGQPMWGNFGAGPTGTYSTRWYGATGTATVANVTASGFIPPSKITISGNYDQSSVTSKFLAYGSLITVNGNGSFTANGTLASTQYNSASLVLNGTNTLTYNNLTSPSINGFNNLTTGQGGNITTTASNFSILTTLTIGSGTLTGASTIYAWGANPLSFDVASSLTITNLTFFGLTFSIPTLTNGYGCNISVAMTNAIVTQTGNVTLNAAKSLYINGGGMVAYVGTWLTDGYNLTVGGNLQIGQGADSGLKKLDATRNVGAGRTSTITVGGIWKNFGTGTAPSQFIADNSTVVLNGTGAGRTITSGSTIIPNAFYNLTFNGTGGVWTLQDNLTASGNILHTAGTLSLGGKNITTTGSGNLTISDGALITASGLASSTVTVAGNFSASGHSGALITLNPASTWYLNVAGTAFADYVNVAYSNASGGNAIIWSNFTDSGNNINWSSDITPPVVTVASPINNNNYTNALIDFSASASDTNLGSIIPNLDNSLVSWWKMDDNAGDKIVTDYMGANNGTSATNTSVIHTAGKLGGAMTFNGSTSFIKLDTATDFGITDKMTASVWVKFNNSDTNKVILGTQGSSNGFVIRQSVNTPGKLQWQVLNTIGGATNLQTSATYSDNQWHLVTGTYDGSNTVLYIDGIYITKGSLTGNVAYPSAYPFSIGCYAAGRLESFSVFNGSIDDVMIFNRALTTDEITGLYNATAISHSSTLSIGDHTYKAYAQDLLGNVGSSTLATFTITPTVTVSKQGSQISTTTIPVTGQNLGGAFTLLSQGNATTTSIKIKQVGSIATSSFSNVKLYYKAESDCGAVKPSDATWFGTAGSFDTNGVATTTGTMTLSDGNKNCLYLVYDLIGTFSTSSLGNSVDFEINNPSTDIILSAGTVSTTGVINISGRTIAVNDVSLNPEANPTSCTNSGINSLLSLKMRDPIKNPTVFYLENCAVWKMEGGGTPIRLTNPNLQVQSLIFTNLTGSNSGGAVRVQMTMSNVNASSGPSYINTTKTYSTTATVKTWLGN